MSTKKERFNDAYDYLTWRRIIRVQEDLAKAMHSSQANVSQALKGEPRVLTDKFIKRFAAAFPGLFNLEWLLTGTGNMLLADAAQTLKPTPTATAADTSASASPTSSLLDLCTHLLADNERLHHELSLLIDENKKLREDLSQILAELRHRATINQTYNLAPTDIPMVAENSPEK